MRLLIDMDGVIADMVSEWVKLANRYHGQDLKNSDITEWNMAACPGASISVEDSLALIAEPGFFRHLDPIPHALPVLNQLHKDGHEIFFVTFCFSGHNDKRKWLERHLPEIPLNRLIFAERKDIIAGDIFLDDGTHNLKPWALANPNKLAVCFNAAYNQEWRGQRVYDWRQFYYLVKEHEALRNDKK